MESFFGEAGILSRILSGYEPRPEQETMAEAIRETLATGGHLIVEAGTGVGKSLAYLIPLISHVLSEEGSRAVVSTYTKALQRQLIEKELPFLKEHVFSDLRFALCLGSENYLCLRRLDLAKTHGLFESEEAAALTKLRAWARKTDTGIRAEVDVPSPLWQKVCRESDICYGKDCRRSESCFYQRAKTAERKAHILVTNHHLFFANVASGWNVLPPFDTVVFDEAHQIEDVAADYLGLEFSNYRLRYILDSVVSLQNKGLLSRLAWLPPSVYLGMSSLVNSVRARGELFFEALGEKVKDVPTLRVRERGFLDDNLSEALATLAAELKVLRDSAENEDEGREISALALRSEALGLSLRLILGQELEDHVYWAEKDGRRVRLAATPLDIASILRTQVFDTMATAVLTSATLATQENFDFIKERLGLPGAKTLLLRSPFDYARQVALYIPEAMSEPGSEGFEDDLIAELKEILGVTLGRTMVLFTSYGLLNRVYQILRIPGVEVLKQGDMENYRLLKVFRKKRHAVLFGTYTFWQGVDIPGDDLQCVVITKLPFAVPDEPVIEARLETLVRKGKNPFREYQVPQAAILLKQGFGRLIRTRTDRGAVVVMDRRIRTRGYGAQFIKSLPECKITASLQDVRDMLAGECERR